MIVCIAEKPSVARDLAEVLGASVRREGYFEGNGYQVTWTFGHLCGLLEPHEYTPSWKPWALSLLPMIPQPFGIKVMDDKGVIKQFKVIESLISKATEVVNCGDAGQEGELIQRWVLQKALCKVPVKRLWISSLTEDAIREGFKSLKDQSDYQRLYEAGLSRAIGDWLLGMNATRLYTLKYGRQQQVLSIGRVQTPTLALIVNRYLEIQQFKPERYFELKTVYRSTIFSSAKGKFASEDEGKELLSQLQQDQFTVTDVSTKKGTESAPRLFDLTSLQVECNKKYGFSAEETLRYIQSLYEKKLTTYPRVDTTYLSEDMHPKVPAIMKGLKDFTILTAPVLAAPIHKSKKVFDNAKVTDHHAIIPTGIHSLALSAEERKVFEMIVLRFIANFYPECKISTTTVLGASAGLTFKVTGKQILEAGWRQVFDGNEEKEEQEATLPTFVNDEQGPHEPGLAEKYTTPPKLFTEATLLRAMETAGKLVDNDELREAMKENGIGRPSTRAAIIETLFRRNYIQKEKKNLVPTPTGIELIQIIQEDLLKSAELTGIWEKKLREIETGSYAAGQFLDELKQMLREIVYKVKCDNRTTQQLIGDSSEK